MRLRGIIVGAGVMGSLHLRVLSQMRSGVEVVGLVDPAEEARDRAVVSYPDLPCFGSFEDALVTQSPDFVVLAAPADKLPALARTAIAAGVPTLVEKPFAASEDDAVEIAREAEASGVFLGVGLVERFNPAVKALKGLLAEKEIGRIYQLHARRLSPYPFRQKSVGVALDLATHDIDVIRYLTGQDVKRVYAETLSRNGSGNEDFVSACLALDDESRVLIEANWLTPTKIRELTVLGEGGMFQINYVTQDLYFYENPRVDFQWDALEVTHGTGEGNMTRFALPRKEPLVEEWEQFFAALREGAPPPATAWDGYASLSVARAIKRSGETATPVVPGYRTSDQGPASLVNELAGSLVPSD